MHYPASLDSRVNEDEFSVMAQSLCIALRIGLRSSTRLLNAYIFAEPTLIKAGYQL